MMKIVMIYTFCLLASVTLQAQKNEKDNSVETAEVSKTDRVVLISTSFGNMTVKLYDATPLHRDNFIKLANDNFYDSLIFHRVIQGFMIQGGDPQSRNSKDLGALFGAGDNGYTVPAEFVDSLFHKKGTLCAARTNNPEKASSGCQFYIVQGAVQTKEQLAQMEIQRKWKYSDNQKQLYSTIGGTPMLDKGYTVFGEVTEGLDVLDKIAAVEKNESDRPLENVYILKVSVLK